jgi:hypothetical protein
MPAPLDPAGLFATLGDHGVHYVLIGGLAGVIRGSTAMTNDADVVPARDAENLARLSDALRSLDARLRSESDPEGIPFDAHPALLAQMTTVNLTTSCGDLDVAFSPAGIAGGYDELVPAGDTYELYGHRVRVASLAHIIGSKEAADRPKDRAVLPILYALRDELADGGAGPAATS